MTVVPIAARAASGGAAAGASVAGARSAAAGARGSAGSSARTGTGTPPRAAGGGWARFFRSGAARRPDAGNQGRTEAPGPGAQTSTPAASPSDPTKVAGPSLGSQLGDALRSGERRFDSAAGEARTLTLKPPKRITANDGAGFLGGLLLYTLALNYLRYGPEGVKGWLGAKFVNRPFTIPDDSTADGRLGKADKPGDDTPRSYNPYTVGGGIGTGFGGTEVGERE